MTDNLLKKVRDTITSHNMLRYGDRVVVGVSAGPDSVCLLHVLHQFRDELKLNLHALYIDHGLRPDETPAEIEFCKKMCEGSSVRFIVKAIDVTTYAKGCNLNKQDAARELRYRAFEEAAFEIKADKIALGHNADDQIETFFMRIFRGSGPKGLSGIPPVRGKIIRPLIEVERWEIEKFLEEDRVNYIVDSSNLKEDYLRNKIRLSFLPEVKKINPDIIETMSRTMEIFREEEKFFDILVTKTLMKLISRKTAAHIELFLSPMESMEKVILRRVLRRAIDETKGLRGIGFAHIEDIMDLIRQGRHGDRLYLPKGLRAIKNYATLVMTSETPVKIGTYGLDVPGEVVIRETKTVIKVSVAEKAEDYGDGKSAIVLDADKINMPMTVRAREDGDFFYPMGFGRRKKLQDFFVDEKMPRDERDSIPIVVSGNDIVWIAGYRGDERVKVTEATKRFIRMEIKAGLT